MSIVSVFEKIFGVLVLCNMCAGRIAFNGEKFYNQSYVRKH